MIISKSIPFSYKIKTTRVVNKVWTIDWMNQWKISVRNPSSIISFHFISSHLISSHFTSSHIISFHFISSIIRNHHISFHFAASVEAFSEWSASISQSLAMDKEKEEAKKIIREAEKMKQEIIRKAEIEAAKIMQSAKDQVMGKIRTQSSDDFRTPEDRIRRTGSDDQAALVQISSEPSASPAASNAGSSSSKKQASLHAFIKSPTPKHVIQHPLFSKRVQESKEMSSQAASGQVWWSYSQSEARSERNRACRTRWNHN